MRRYGLAFLVIAALVSSLALAVTAQEKPKYGGIWKDALDSNPPYLDPVQATDTQSSEVINQMFETLVDLHPDTSAVIPLLAERWKISRDGKTYTFYLRKGAKFHKTTEGGKPTANGGREATAEDWVWTLNYICDPKVNSPRAYFINMVVGYEEYQKGETKQISGIKALDKYTLEMKLTYAFAPFLTVMTYNTFVLLPKEDIVKWGKDFNFHPVGTGPFKFNMWRQDDKIVMDKNEEYWGRDKSGNKLPYLDGIEYRVINDFSVQYNEFKLGNIYQSFVDDPFYAEAKSGKVGQFIEKPQPGIYYYGMNCQIPPFKGNVKLRQALNYAIDRKALIDNVLNGRWGIPNAIVPPGVFGYDPEAKFPYKYDPELAKKLLAEAGYPNGFEITLQYNENNRHKRIAEALQAQYARVGVKMNIKVVDWGTHLDTTGKQGTVPFFRMGWVADYPDADNFLYVLLHSSLWGNEGNYARYSNPTVDKLLWQARTEVMPEVRLRLYQKAQQIIIDEAPWVFVMWYMDHSLVQPFVRNYVMPSFGQFRNRFVDVWLDK